jgi:iron complex outermembrane receptor protein
MHYADVMAAARLETADRTDRLNPQPDRGRSTRVTYNLSAQDEVHIAGGRLILSPSARWTRYHGSFEPEDGEAPPPSSVEEGEQLQGRLGFAWLAGGSVTVRGNAGRFYRVPSFTEIFGDEGTVKGSDDLEPEEGLNFDLGIAVDPRPRARVDRMSLEVVFFLTEADNLIQFVQTSQSQVTARNTGRARISGGELSAAIGILGWLDGSLNYTHQIPEDRSGTFTDGADLPGRPRHEASASAGADLRSGRWGRVTYDFDYIGANYFDPAAAVLAGTSDIDRDQLRVPDRYLHGVGYTKTAGRTAFTLEVDNLFDVKTADVVRYPLPGRMIQAKMRFELP